MPRSYKIHIADIIAFDTYDPDKPLDVKWKAYRVAQCAWLRCAGSWYHHADTETEPIAVEETLGPVPAGSSLADAYAQRKQKQLNIRHHAHESA